MTKWLKQLTRLQDVDNFLQMLKDKNVITQNVKEVIQQSANGTQMHTLVLHMLEETKIKQDIYHFCQCLRRIDSRMADLLENNTSDGKSIGNDLLERL